jgi:hydrogenase expression/formation protein HypD
MKPGMFRDREMAHRAAALIRRLAPESGLKFMHVCGTHEQVITRFGLRALLPKNVEIIPGPGCPVCVTPAKEIEEAISLAEKSTVLTFGDMFRIPGATSSLAATKAKGGDVRVVYSVKDAVDFAKENPGKEVVFFSVGFETTVPTVASEILNKPPENFSLLVSHRLIPPMMELLLGIGDVHIDGWLCPGHVATIIGAEPFRLFPTAYGMPTVISGFEPLDVLMSLVMLLKQVKEGKPRLDNEYSRSVREKGNPRAKKMMEEVFEVTSGYWRGIGRVPSSALKLREEFAEYDARKKFGVKVEEEKDILLESCHLVINGKLRPEECPLFSKACTPATPRGPTMVSSEGACNILYKYGGLDLRG